MNQRLEREAESARESAQRVGDKVQRQAEEVTSDLQAQAQDMVTKQKEMARSGFMDVASAIRSAADNLEQHDQSQVASLARSVAGGIEDFSESIGRRNFQDMISDAQRFAREHPAAVFGGAVLAGLAIARFAKSSSQPTGSHMRAQSTGTEATGMPHATERTGQGGRLAEFARHERELGRGAEAGSTR